MIELTTGILFLASSLYAGGHTVDMAQTVSTTSQSQATSTTYVSTSSSFTNSKNIESYVRKEFTNEPILVEVARCESTFRQYDSKGNIIRGKVNSADVGVMQINEKYHADEAAKLGYDIYTTEGNVAFAKYLYGKYGAQPWTSSSPCWSQELAKI
ncbi:MAG: hypothetical protein WCG07_03180 [Candidatus Taylorbacteria bacterium]